VPFGNSTKRCCSTCRSAAAEQAQCSDTAVDKHPTADQSQLRLHLVSAKRERQAALMGGFLLQDMEAPIY